MVVVAKGLAGEGACRRYRAQDLTMAVWGARGEDGEPYPGWHEAAEGHGRSGDGEGRRRLGELGGGAFGVRRKGKEAGLSSVVERLRRGCLYIGSGGSRWRSWSFNALAVSGNGASSASFQSKRGEEAVRRPFQIGGRMGQPGGGPGLAAVSVGGGADRAAALCVTGGRG
jgi:hypothetical protein